jgi:CRP/FNR family transcriptional regulator
LFAGGVYPASAIAFGEVECLVIDRTALESAITVHPALAFVFLGRMAGRVRHLLERLSSQTADPVAARLARFMVDRTPCADGTIARGGTQAQLAEEIGTVREVVVRLLRALADEGIIERLDRGRYRVLNRARLQQRAEDGT